MKSLLKGLWNSETMALRVLRAALMAFAAYKLGGTEHLLAMIAAGGAGFLGAGEPNPEPKDGKAQE